MSERSRRDILTYAGVTIAASGLLSTSGTATSASRDGDGTVYLVVSDDDRGCRFFAFDADDGSVAWSLDTEEILWPLALADDTIYVGTSSGDDRLFALRSQRRDDGEDAAENESENASSGDGETEDEVPGFTAGAGLAGGALGLEWLRRRAVGDEPDE